MAVFLSDEQDREVDGDDLVRLARHVMAERRIPQEMELSVLLVDEDTIATMNERHLGVSGPTDVLAFPIDEPGDTPPGPPAILGDVMLCPAVAADQAPRFDRSPQEELRMLTVHGILHLLGMDHADVTAEREMFALTEELLASYRQLEGEDGAA